MMAQHPTGGKGGPVGADSVGFFVLDVESVADGELVAKLRYPEADLSPREAIDRYREELLRDHNSDFIPYTYQVPVSVVIAKVAPDFRLLDLVALDEPRFRPAVITEHFWRGWSRYERPTLVTFNGRSFDLPLMELAAFRFGLSVPEWFDVRAKSYDQRRNRYNTRAHLDLHDALTNFGATRFHGGLNLAAHLLGKPGKMHVQGEMVQDLYHADKLVEINEYCRCDVLDTYFVFLRIHVLWGELTLDRERELVQQTRQWLLDRREEHVAYADYLEHWGDWSNPWTASPSGERST